MSNDLERRTTINESSANYSADEAAIRDLYRELMDAWRVVPDRQIQPAS